MRFVLLHGGAHGGWAWDSVAPLLRAGGHEVSCPELPIDDGSATVQHWADAACRQIDLGDSEELVLVAHSVAGLAMPVIATMREVARMVFLCAVVPLPGRRHGDCLGEPPTAITLPSDRLEFDSRGSMVVPWPTAREFYYHDCDSATARAAWGRLRPCAQQVWRDRSPLESWPATPSAYVMGKYDRALSPDYSRRAAQELLDVEPIELNSGHSPMLSHPEELALTLDMLASTPTSLWTES
jgi:pimeloyl-ACP methyl ester carboxylesterase